jgi:hypothetical protein
MILRLLCIWLFFIHCYKIIIVQTYPLSNKTTRIWQTVQVQVQITNWQAPKQNKEKTSLPKVYLYSNIHTEMQCGKVMA